MPIIVLTKKNLLMGLLVIGLLAAAVFLFIRFRHREGEPTAAAMAPVESYELNVLPMRDRALPVYAVGREDSEIALTIDAAWDADKTPFILDTLDKFNVKATFFLCGVWVKQYPEYVKEISKRGHEIGNHSLTHLPTSLVTAAPVLSSSLSPAFSSAGQSVVPASGWWSGVDTQRGYPRAPLTHRPHQHPSPQLPH